jgi:dolichol-phosphate mannosyltransferase
MHELSVIIPTLNEQPNVRRIYAILLKALERQGLADFEVLYVDDQSADGTQDRVRELGREDPRAKLVINPERRGLGAALWHGVERSSGKFVLFLDCDCSVTGDDLTRLIAAREVGTMLVGSRYIKGSRIYGAPRLKVELSRALNFLASLIFRFPIVDLSHSLRIFERLPQTAPQTLTHPGFFWELSLFYRRVGRLKEIPISFYERELGFTKNRSLRMVKSILSAAKRLIREEFA